MEIVLVHGSYHGGWCWDLLRPELEALGHRVTVVDLPISDPAAGADRYADVVAAAIRTVERPVIVGHSMAGLVIPIVASRRPVARLIFLAAFLPRPGASANDQRAAEPVDGTIPPSTAEWMSLGDDVWTVGCATATELFFGDVRPDIAAWACDRLRPQAYRVMNEPSPLHAWPDVDSRSIVCRADRAINPDWVRTASLERLGVRAIEIDGGHSPFLSRPVELAAILGAVAGEEP